MPLDAVAEKHEALVDVGDVGLGLRQLQPHRRQDLRDLVAQVLGVGAVTVDGDDEVVGVTGQPVVRLAVLPSFLAPIRRCHRRRPHRVEVLVEHAQRDVGQQRGQDAALGCAGRGVFQSGVLGEHAGFEKRLDQRQHAFVADTLSHAVHQGRVVDRVEARRDVAFHDPGVSVGCVVAHLGDRVMG